jgi:hypothetical protein
MRVPSNNPKLGYKIIEASEGKLGEGAIGKT